MLFGKMTQISRINLFRASFLNRNITRFSSNKAEAEIAEEDTPVALVQDPEDIEARKRHIEKIRNKSRLSKAHRNILNNKVPYSSEESWVHETLRYKRTMFGRYGLSSGIDPRICFPTETEKADKDEYERVAFPMTLQQMMAKNEQEKKEKILAVQRREEEIEKKMSKLDGWINDLNARVAKKEAEAKAAKDRKDRLVEEVRRHFGFHLDTRDDKFKELLAQKEKEEKKAQKEAKRKQKEMKMFEKLVTKGKEASASATSTTTEVTNSEQK